MELMCTTLSTVAVVVIALAIRVSHASPGITIGLLQFDSNPGLIEESLPQHIMPDGKEFPPIGLGSFDDKQKNEIQKVNFWLNGIEAGYRLLDTGYEYENEKQLGVAIRTLVGDKKIKREDLIITTKVWSTFHTPDRAVDSLRYELRELGVEYSDLVLVHQPMSAEPPPVKDHTWPRVYFSTYDNGTIKPLYWEKDVGYLQAWRGLEAAYSLGLARYIGLSNFNQHQIEKILAVANIKPAVLQVS